MRDYLETILGSFWRVVGGILGTLLTAVFASNGLGVFSGFSDINILDQLSIQLTGVVAAILYTGVMTWIILKVCDVALGNRVNEDDEIDGLDLISHNERGYDL